MEKSIIELINGQGGNYILPCTDPDKKRKAHVENEKALRRVVAQRVLQGENQLPCSLFSDADASEETRLYANRLCHLFRGGSWMGEVERRFPNLTCRHYRKQVDLYLLVNESENETFSGPVKMQMCGPIVEYDAANNALYEVREAELFEDRTCVVPVTLLPGESRILFANNMVLDAILELLLSER